jgi:hypothetical protein
MLETLASKETAWSQKENRAVWRGGLTGHANETDSDLKVCLSMERCRLVYNSHDASALFDARLTNTRGKVPDTVGGRAILGERMNINNMLEYKGLVVLEGKDVAPALRWAMLSQSVILMPTPRFTSWVIEELLEPWVHYIPLQDDLTDMEEKI